VTPRLAGAKGRIARVLETEGIDQLVSALRRDVDHGSFQRHDVERVEWVDEADRDARFTSSSSPSRPIHTGVVCGVPSGRSVVNAAMTGRSMSSTALSGSEDVLAPSTPSP
jgi:hypothetical protein